MRWLPFETLHTLDQPSRQLNGGDGRRHQVVVNIVVERRRVLQDVVGWERDSPFTLQIQFLHVFVPMGPQGDPPLDFSEMPTTRDSLVSYPDVG